jgi:Ceramidase
VKHLTLLILTGLAVVGAALLLVMPRIAQPQWYHDFADQRALLGIPSFWNVISNLPFLIVGGWGIGYLASPGAKNGVEDLNERWMYLFLFFMIALTGIGSAYYHLKPNNDRLVWDRLPLAMMFMALFAIIVVEHLSRRLGTLLFLPLALIGGASVFYWHVTETWGRGDLRPYLLTQIYPVIAIPVILWLCPSKYSKTEKLYAAMAWYLGAKVYEFLDKDLYSFGRMLSGHTLKHIGAAMSCYMILSWIRHRRLVRSPVVQPNQPSTTTEKRS